MIFDASSLINLAKRGKIDKAYKGITLPLALYEIGNALWREASLLKNLNIKLAQEFLTTIANFIKENMILENPNYEEVLNVALDFDITFYDASYVYLAIKYSDTLVTDDEKLTSKVKNKIKVLRTRDIL